MEEFAKRLHDLRTARELSQIELAQLTNLSKSAISFWERAERIPLADAVIVLAKFFGVTTDFLLGLTDY